MSDVPRILGSVGLDGAATAEELLPLVYEELRKLAAHKLANETPGQTLQPTALVHEAWLRLRGDGLTRWDGRVHFCAAAAEAMRRILIDNARRKNAAKRGGGLEWVELQETDPAIEVNETVLLRIDEALELLAREDSAAAEVVKLRYFAGLTNAEAAQALGVSERTVKRHWTFARAWLFEHLNRRTMARLQEQGSRAAFGVRWLAGNGTDTALVCCESCGFRHSDEKAACALAPHPPHSKRFAAQTLCAFRPGSDVVESVARGKWVAWPF